MNQVERLRGFAVQFGLTYSDGSEPAWAGKADGVPIRIVAMPGRNAQSHLRIELALPAGHPSLLVIAAQHVLSFEKGLRTGDTTCDEQVFIQANDATPLGCFDATTRQLAVDLMELGVFVSGGAVRLDCDGLRASADIDTIVPRMVRFAKRLSIDAAHAAQELARLAHTDPDPAVRSMFQRHLDGSAALRDADLLERVRSEGESEDAALVRLTNQLHDPKSGRAVRLEAATRLITLFPMKRIARALSLVASDIATPVIERLVQLMRLQNDTDAETLQLLDVAAGVLIEVATRTPNLDDTTLEMLLGALALVNLPASYDLALRLCERKNAAVVERALVVLHKLDRPVFELMRALSPAALAQMQQVLPSFARKHPKLGASLLIAFFERIEPRYVGPRVAYLRAMALTCDGRVAARIAKHIESPYEDEQLAVIETLGQLGDLSVVPALKTLTEGLFRAGELKAAARASIEAIRQREGARSLPGALSLSESAGAGALSLSDEALGSQANAKQPRHDEE